MIEIFKERDVDLNVLIFEKWRSLRSTKLKYLSKGAKVDLDFFLELCKTGIEFDLEDPMYGLLFNTRWRDQTDPKWSRIKTQKIKTLDGKYYGEIEHLNQSHAPHFNADIIPLLINVWKYDCKNKDHNDLLNKNIILVPIINSEGKLETFDLGSRLWKDFIKL